MTMVKVLIKDTPRGFDLRCGWEEENANDAEKDLAIKLGNAVNNMLTMCGAVDIRGEEKGGSK